MSYLLKKAIAFFASSWIPPCIHCDTNNIGKDRPSQIANRILCFALQIDNYYQNFPEGLFCNTF